jgi:large subunit ribosomal protein L23
MSTYDVIENPLVTEKGTILVEAHNQYLFRVHPKSTKRQIAQAVEAMFNVKVTGVRTMMMLGKYKRLRAELGKKPNWKKAVVTLKAGDKIDLAS